MNFNVRYGIGLLVLSIVSFSLYSAAGHHHSRSPVPQGQGQNLAYGKFYNSTLATVTNVDFYEYPNAVNKGGSSELSPSEDWCYSGVPINTSVKLGVTYSVQRGESKVFFLLDFPTVTITKTQADIILAGNENDGFKIQIKDSYGNDLAKFTTKPLELSWGNFYNSTGATVTNVDFYEYPNAVDKSGSGTLNPGDSWHYSGVPVGKPGKLGVVLSVKNGNQTSIRQFDFNDVKIPAVNADISVRSSVAGGFEIEITGGTGKPVSYRGQLKLSPGLFYNETQGKVTQAQFSDRNQRSAPFVIKEQALASHGYLIHSGILAGQTMVLNIRGSSVAEKPYVVCFDNLKISDPTAASFALEQDNTGNFILRDENHTVISTKRPEEFIVVVKTLVPLVGSLAAKVKSYAKIVEPNLEIWQKKYLTTEVQSLIEKISKRMNEGPSRGSLHFLTEDFNELLALRDSIKNLAEEKKLELQYLKPSFQTIETCATTIKAVIDNLSAVINNPQALEVLPAVINNPQALEDFLRQLKHPQH